LGDGVSGH
ncbi:GHMP kinase N terminal domain protein, partial [Vibrio parahaemolyticus V-223/04]